MNSRLICWYSTPESREAGKVSVLAVVETILSVAAYWWIAVAFDTYVHLVTSIVIAPLVLLRSDASIMLGAEMFGRYYDRDEIDLKNSTWALVAVLTAVGFGFAASFLAEYWLAAHTGWSLFWRAAVLGGLAINISIAVAVAVAGALAVALAVGGVVGGAVGGVVGGAMAIAGPGIAMGILIRILLIRIWATASHLIVGFQTFPNNWQNLNARTDVFRPLELIPGLPSNHDMSFGSLIDDWKYGVGARVLLTIIMPFFYFSSLAYRYSLKSTAWLYLPVIWIVHVPAKLQEVDGVRVWVWTAGRTWWDWLRIVLAVIVLAAAAAASFGGVG